MHRLLSALLLASAPALLHAQAQPVPVTAAKPGWKWTMDSVNAVVNEVRAGRSLQPAAWPNGSRVAVLLSFDVDNETIAIRYGEPTVGSLAEMQYGARVGLPRIMRLLDKHKIPASFFIPSVSLAITPSMADLIKKSGRHEFAVHGWIHELNMTLPDSAERALLTKAVAELTALTGQKPTGYRAPSWNFSPNTLSILRDMGFRYESSLMADDAPYELVQRGHHYAIVDEVDSVLIDDARTPLIISGPTPNGDKQEFDSLKNFVVSIVAQQKSVAQDALAQAKELLAIHRSALDISSPLTIY